MNAKEAIDKYKEWYTESYGVKPTEKLVETFCRINGIEVEREEVVKVEETKEYSVLNNAQVVTNVTEHMADHHTEEDYKALEVTYQNMLAEHQEICAIAQEQKQTIEDDNVLIVKLSTNMGKLLNIMDYYKDLFSPSDIGRLDEIKKEVEGLRYEQRNTESTK